MFEKLFSPITIKDMELKNRVVLPAMGTKFSGKTRDVTKTLIDYHVARVKGGSGLNIVEVYIRRALRKDFFHSAKTHTFQASKGLHRPFMRREERQGCSFGRGAWP